jgi:endoglucanase
MTKEQIKEHLRSLCEGDLDFSENYLVNELKKFLDVVENHEGYIIGYNNDDKPKVVFDAHIDTVCLMVQYIEDDGFVRFSVVGSIDPAVLPAKQVKIFNKLGDISGVIGSLPPHFSKEKDEKTPLKIEEMYVDFGFKSKKEADEHINLGDRIYIDSKFKEIKEDILIGSGMDDRAGIAAILYTLSIISGECKNSPVVIFSNNEEIAEIGAKIAAADVKEKFHPEFAVAVDVSFAFTPDAPKEKCGHLGEGAMVGISPTLNKKLSEKLILVAKSQNIPFQIEVMSGQTSTNADQYGGVGIKTATVSIPLRYMHTPSEIVSIKDIENAGNLLEKCLNF